jgi:hypothetical protein
LSSHFVGFDKQSASTEVEITTGSPVAADIRTFKRDEQAHFAFARRQE